MAKKLFVFVLIVMVFALFVNVFAADNDSDGGVVPVPDSEAEGAANDGDLTPNAFWTIREFAAFLRGTRDDPVKTVVTDKDPIYQDNDCDYWRTYAKNPDSLIFQIEALDQPLSGGCVSLEFNSAGPWRGEKYTYVEYPYLVPNVEHNYRIDYYYHFFFEPDIGESLLASAKELADNTQTVAGHEVYSFVTYYKYNSGYSAQDLRVYVWEQNGYVMRLVDFRNDPSVLDFTYCNADMYTIAEFIEQFETVTIDTPQEGKNCPEE